jgi:hypothetical protein
MSLSLSSWVSTVLLLLLLLLPVPHATGLDGTVMTAFAAGQYLMMMCGRS